MSSTSLSIVLKAIDEATAPLNKVTGALRTQAAEAAAGADKTGGAWEKAYGKIKAVAEALAAAFAVKKLWGEIKEGAEVLDQVGKSARALGLATESVSLFRYGAAMAHKDFSEWSDALGTFQKNLSQFQRTGRGRGADAFEVLGFSRTNLTDESGQLRKFDEVFERLVERMNSISDPARRNEIGKRLFGENGASFVRFIAQGSENLKHLRQEAEYFHLIFTPEQTEAANAFRHALVRIEQAWLGLKTRFFDVAGPEMTVLLNYVAAFIGRIPEMVRTLAHNVSAAMSGDPAAKQAFVSFWHDLADTAEAGLKMVGNTVGWVWSGYVQATLSMTTYQVGKWFSDLPGRLADWMAAAAGNLSVDVVAAIGAINPALAGVVARLRQAQGAAGQVLGMGRAAQAAADADEARREFQRAVDAASNSMTEFEDGMNENMGRMHDSAARLWEDFKGLIGAGEALAMAAQFNAHATRGPLMDVNNELTRLEEFRWSSVKAGIGEAWDELTRKAGQVLEFGKELTTSLVNGVASGLSNAIVDAIAGTKSLKEAMRDMASSTLRLVSQMILQFLIMRAVISGANAIGAAFAPNVGPYAGVTNYVGHNRGGEIPRFGGGGVNTDSVLAMLTPGEHVIRREVAVNHRRELAILNAGGRWPGDGGGGSIVNNFSISVSVPNASPGAAQAAGKIVAETVIAQLERSPAMRGRLKGTLGVRV